MLLSAATGATISDGTGTPTITLRPRYRGPGWELQQSRGLAVDGVVGPQTWAALVVTVRQGATGEAVYAVQSQWRGIEHDGMFGPRTDTLVRQFQGDNGLQVDGIVGPLTWRAMGKGAVIDAPA